VERGSGVARSPKGAEPEYDVLWERDGIVWVAEVKSLTVENEERQLSLGLGQVLQYRYRLRESRGEVRAVLMVEYEPRDAVWDALCSDLGVQLLRPSLLDDA
jgi:hypothetical protein